MNWNKEQRRNVFSTFWNTLTTTGDYKEYLSSWYDDDDEEATYESQVGITLDYMHKYNLLPFHETDEPEFLKDPKVSIDFRNDGNKHFMKNNEEALLLYTKSIAAAPYPTSDQVDSEELALGFANRSAVYFVMKKYEACLRDIEQALMFNYPGNLKYKLLERRAKCYQSLGRKEDACASAQNAIRYLSTATHLSEDKLKSTIDALNKLQLDPGSAPCEPPVTTDSLKPLPQKAYGQHKNIPCASECVDIAYDPKVGRHIVANRDIDPGDVLFVEEPFASLLEPSCYFTHCNNCTKRSDAMIPCRQCDQVMYCSEVCREESWESCHRIECKVLPALRRLDVGCTGNSFALRVLLIACSKNNGILGLFNLVQKLNQTTRHNNNIEGFNEDGKYLSSDYHQIHFLFANIREEINAKLTIAVTAASIVNCLEAYTNISFLWKSSWSNMPRINLVLFIGGFVMKYLHVNGTNCHEIADFDENSNYAAIAWGLYSTLSLPNHSCDPSACKAYIGAKVIVTATQPIRKGDKVSIAYGDCFQDTDVHKRRDTLRFKYGFLCECSACTNNWPLFDGLEPLVAVTFICKTCRIPLPKKPLKLAANQRIKCVRCKQNYNLSHMFAEMTMINSRLNYINAADNSMSVSDPISEIANFVKIIDSVILYPNQLMSNCQESLRIWVKTRGDARLSRKLLESGGLQTLWQLSDFATKLVGTIPVL